VAVTLNGTEITDLPESGKPPRARTAGEWTSAQSPLAAGIYAHSVQDAGFKNRCVRCGEFDGSKEIAFLMK
jgi:hypothetical protein